MEPTNHILVPKHVIATDAEVKELLESFGKSVEALPWIPSSDPALLDVKANAGDVVRVERMSPVTKKVEPFYRLVVEGE